MVKNIKQPVQTTKLFSYFLPLPISKTREYFVSTPYPASSLTAKHKGKLPTPTRRNIHNDTCQLHYVVGCEPDYAYVITHLSPPQYLIFHPYTACGRAICGIPYSTVIHLCYVHHGQEQTVGLLLCLTRYYCEAYDIQEYRDTVWTLLCLLAICGYFDRLF